MKKLFYATLFLGLIFIAKPASAQINVSFNIGVQPNWGPAGYDYARYYYLPEIDVYYDISNRNYHYYNGRRWIANRHLPRHYHRVDLYRTYKVVINDRNPWNNHRRHHDHYRGYSRNYSQVAWRDHKDARRYEKSRNKEIRRIEKAHGKHHRKMDKRYPYHR